MPTIKGFDVEEEFKEFDPAYSGMIPPGRPSDAPVRMVRLRYLTCFQQFKMHGRQPIVRAILNRDSGVIEVAGMQMAPNSARALAMVLVDQADFYDREQEAK